MVDSSAQSTTRRAAHALVGNALSPVASVLIAPVLAHGLGVDGRGLVAAASAPAMLAVAAGTFGLPDAVTYFVARSPRTTRRVLRSAVKLQIIAGSFTVALLLALEPVLKTGDKSYFPLFVLSIISIIPTLIGGLYRGIAAANGQWALISLERGLSALVRLMLVASAAFAGRLTPTVAVISVVFPGALTWVVYATRRTLEHHTQEGDDPPRRALTGYATRVWFGSIAGLLLLRLDQALLGPLSSERQLGLYAVAVSVSELPLVVNSALRDVLFAVEAADPSTTRLISAARASGAICLAFGALIALSMRFWYGPVFGEDFVAGAAAAQILIVGVAVGPVGSVAGAGLSARGRPELRSIALLAGLVVNVILLLTLVPHQGAVGAAWATLAGNALTSNMCIAFAASLLGVRFRDFYLVRSGDFRPLINASRSVLQRVRGVA